MSRLKSISTLFFDLLAYFDKASTTVNKMDSSLRCNNDTATFTSLVLGRTGSNESFTSIIFDFGFLHS
jgi:hypothetical protein